MTNLPPSVLTQEVAAILRAAKARKNFSQADLCESIDVSQSQLSKMFRGLRPITIDQLDILCEVLDIDMMETLAEADEQTESRAGMNKVSMRLNDTNAERAKNGVDPLRDDLLVVTDYEQTEPLKGDELAKRRTEKQYPQPVKKSARKSPPKKGDES